MGGTLTTSPAYRLVLSGRLVGDISTHCWVLKEQTFFPGKKDDEADLQSYRLLPFGVGVLVLSSRLVLCVV
jgi:hypothetical protein